MIFTFGSLTLLVKGVPGGVLGDRVLGRMAEARATGPTCGRFPSGTLDLGKPTTSLGTVFLVIPEYNSATLPRLGLEVLL